MNVARHIHNSSGCSYREAWRQSLARTQKSRTSRELHPITELAPVCARYAAWRKATAFNEHTFAFSKELLIHKRHAHETTEFVLIKIVRDRKPSEDNEIIGLAQEYWAQSYGDVRNSPAEPRADVGRKRKSTQDSEAAFLRKRRKEVLELELNDDDEEVAEKWTAGHVKEVEFQDNKILTKKVEAYMDGLLLPEEEDAELREAVAAKQKNMKANAADRDRAERTVREVVGIKSGRDFKDEGIWIAESVDGVELRARITELGAHVEHDRLKATVFIVENPSDPGMRVAWVSAMTGSLVTTANRIIKNEGPMIQYQAAINTPRSIYVSTTFANHHPEIWKVLEASPRMPTSKWKVMNDLLTFLQVFAKADKSHRGANALALITSHENKEDSTMYIATNTIYQKSMAVSNMTVFPSFLFTNRNVFVWRTWQPCKHTTVRNTQTCL